MIYVVEHLEPFLSKWVRLEYAHISAIVGKKNLLFTNIKKKADAARLVHLGKVSPKSVTKLKLKNACILDPSSKLALSRKDAHFRYLIFGGILGDAPMLGRTKKELSSKLSLPARNLGRRQMSTDTAIYVAKKIISGIPFSKIRFRDKIEIAIAKHESVILPFRYALVKNKPLLPPGLVAYLKARKIF